MDTNTVTVELPATLYADLQSLAEDQHLELVDMLSHWTEQARQRRAWIEGWRELGELVRQEGGLQVGTTKEEIVGQMRKTRYEIWEAEYAHLYR